MQCTKFFRAQPLGLRLGLLALAAGWVGTVLAAAVVATPAQAMSVLLIDADSGKVLHAENATSPWYPASTTKLMTLYMTLTAIRDHRINPDTLFTVSANANAQSPTKMGFPIGTQVTVDNAIKMMMVKSANDMAVLLAEGIGGSIDQFAQEMTATAHRLGMTESNFVNPNGLPDGGQIMSARDLAILARALIHDFPEYSSYWHIPAIKFGRRVVRNYNPLLGRYPGTDGMKTGFICASGYNLVATASRDNKQLIVVVLGAPSGAARAIKAAELLETGFTQNPLTWLLSSLTNVNSLTPIDVSPPDLSDQICGPHRKRHQNEESDDADASDETDSSGAENNPQFSAMLAALRAPSSKNLLNDIGPVTPVVVYTGPTRTPDQIAALAALPEAAEAVKKKSKHKLAVAKQTEDGKVAAKPAEASKAAAKPAPHKVLSSKAGETGVGDGKASTAAATASAPKKPVKPHPKPAASQQ
ncbi:MAG: D-alanyl-D-alanine carboxypeptidase family protein [Xanthobacteraceae bacterium]